MIDVPLQSNGGRWWAKLVPRAYELPMPRYVERPNGLQGLPYLQTGTTTTLAPGDALLTGRYARTGAMTVDLTFIAQDGELRSLDASRELSREVKPLVPVEALLRGSGALQIAVRALWVLRLGLPIYGDRMLK